MEFDSLVVKVYQQLKMKKDPLSHQFIWLHRMYKSHYQVSKKFGYGRGENRTRFNLEALVSQLEGVKHGFAFSSGMAATTTVFNLFKQGDKVLLNCDLYSETYRYADKLFTQQGIDFELVDDVNDLTDTDLTPNVKAIFIETPSNPLLRVIDI